MKKQVSTAVLAICMTLQLCGCASAAQTETRDAGAAAMEQPYTADTRISDVGNDPVFGDYGCQRRFEIVRKRRRNFVVFRRGGNKN